MSNPLDEALESKEAAQLNLFGGNSAAGRFASTIGHGLSGAGAEIGKTLATGAAGALGAAAIGGVTMGAKKLLDAASKKRDFIEMMGVNPDLAYVQEENPKFFNHAYTSLRSLAPMYAKDPIVSGALMRRMMDSPQGAGSILMSTVGVRDVPRDSVALEAGVGPLRIRKDL